MKSIDTSTLQIQKNQNQPEINLAFVPNKFNDSIISMELDRTSEISKSLLQSYVNSLPPGSKFEKIRNPQYSENQSIKTTTTVTKKDQRIKSGVCSMRENCSIF